MLNIKLLLIVVQPKNDSINITNELSKTKFWKELVNSDKQLEAEREQKARKRNSRRNSLRMSFKFGAWSNDTISSDNNDHNNNHHNNGGGNGSHQTKKATTSHIPAIDEDVSLPLLSTNQTASNNSNSIPQIIVLNTCTKDDSTNLQFLFLYIIYLFINFLVSISTFYTKKVVVVLV